jgi:diadenosine tetraphosphate (Ap4A) HIT family hydrolase
MATETVPAHVPIVSDFVLHPQITADTHWLCDGPLCRVLLMNDARYPWLILVPQRPAVTELHELKAEDRGVLIEEIARASLALKTRAGIAKVNVGALGNIVPQLHVHVVGRSPGDAAWPGPVWGRGERIRYAPDRLEALAQELRAQLASAMP